MDYAFHDSKLVSISIIGPKEIHLLFELLDGTELSVVLEGVRHFKCDNFLEGNIVFDFEQKAFDSIPYSEYERLLNVKSGSSQEYISRISDQILQGALKLFTLTSSYGANLITLCEDMSFSPK